MPISYSVQYVRSVQLSSESTNIKLLTSNFQQNIKKNINEAFSKFSWKKKLQNFIWMLLYSRGTVSRGVILHFLGNLGPYVSDMLQKHFRIGFRFCKDFRIVRYNFKKSVFCSSSIAMLHHVLLCQNISVKITIGHVKNVSEYIKTTRYRGI